MNVLRWIVIGAGGGLLVLGSATMVGAEISGDNGCQATGSWQEAGLTVDAATVDGVVTVPRSDTVDWQGSVAAPPGAYSGSVWVELPPPFGQVEIDAWSGDSQTTSNSGSHMSRAIAATKARLPASAGPAITVCGNRRPPTRHASTVRVIAAAK